MSRVPLKILEKIQETADTCSLRLAVPDGLRAAFAYEAGQYLHIGAELEGETVERSYSLSSTPAGDPYLQITVKRIDGGRLSPLLVDSVQPGDVVQASQPQGRFFKPQDTAQHYLLFAAGSGITPIYSILKRVLADTAQNHVTLIYGSRTVEDIIFRAELEALCQSASQRLHVVHVLSRETGEWPGAKGRVTAALLHQSLAGWAPVGALPEIAYMCGPVDFMDGVTTALLARGLKPDRIRRESYDVADAAALDIIGGPTRVIAAPQEDAEPHDCERLEIMITGENLHVTPNPNETILAAIIRAGGEAPFSCQEGTCLSCMCRVEKGAVRMKEPEEGLLDEADMQSGVALACISLPLTREVRISFDDV